LIRIPFSIGDELRWLDKVFHSSVASADPWVAVASWTQH
jgi:hypothetical protein